MSINSSSASASPLIPQVFGVEQFRETLQKLANSPKESKIRAVVLRLGQLGFIFKSNSSPTLDLLVYQFIEYGVNKQWLKPDDVIFIQEIAKYTLNQPAKQHLEQLSLILINNFFGKSTKKLLPNIKTKDQEADASTLLFEEEVLEEGKSSGGESSDQEMKDEKEKSSPNEQGMFLQEERKPLSEKQKQTKNMDTLQKILDPSIFEWILTLISQDQSLEAADKHLLIEKLFHSIKKTFFHLHVEQDEDGELTERRSLKINPIYSTHQLRQIIYLSMPFLKNADEDQSIFSMRLLAKTILENSSEHLENLILALGLNISDAEQRLDSLKVIVEITGNGNISAPNGFENEARLYNELMNTPHGSVFLERFTLLLRHKAIFGNGGILFKHLISSLQRHPPSFINQTLYKWLKLPKILSSELISRINPIFNHPHDSQLIAIYIGAGFLPNEWETLITNLSQTLNMVPIIERIKRAEMLVLAQEFNMDQQNDKKSITYSFLEQVLNHPEEIEEGIEYLLKEPSGSVVIDVAPVFSETEMAIPLEEWEMYLKKIIELLKMMPQTEESERLVVLRILIPLLQQSAIDQRLKMLQGLISIVANSTSKVKSISFHSESQVMTKVSDSHNSFIFLLKMSLFLENISSDQNRLNIIHLISANKRELASKFDYKEWESTFKHWNDLHSTQSQQLLQLLEPVFEHPDNIRGHFQIWQNFTNDEVGKKFAEEFIQFVESNPDEKKKASPAIFHFMLKKELDQWSILTVQQNKKLFQLLKRGLECSNDIKWYFEIKQKFTNDEEGRVFAEKLIQFLEYLNSNKGIERSTEAFSIFQTVLESEEPKNNIPFPVDSLLAPIDPVASALSLLMTYHLKDPAHPIFKTAIKLSDNDKDELEMFMDTLFLISPSTEEYDAVLTIFSFFEKEKWNNIYEFLRNPLILEIAKQEKNRVLFLELFYMLDSKLEPELNSLIGLYNEHISAVPISCRSSFPDLLRSLLRMDLSPSELQLIINFCNEYISDFPISYRSSFPELLKSILYLPHSELKQIMNRWKDFPVELKDKLLLSLKPIFPLHKDTLHIAILKVSFLSTSEKLPIVSEIEKRIVRFIDHLFYVLSTIPANKQVDCAEFCILLSKNTEKGFFEKISKVLTLFPSEKRSDFLSQPILRFGRNALKDWINSIKQAHPEKTSELELILETSVDLKTNPESFGEVLYCIRDISTPDLVDFLKLFFETSDLLNRALKLELLSAITASSFQNPLSFLIKIKRMITETSEKMRIKKFITALIQMIKEDKKLSSIAGEEPLFILFDRYSMVKIEAFILGWLETSTSTKKIVCTLTANWKNPLDRIKCAMLLRAHPSSSHLFEWVNYFMRESSEKDHPAIVFFLAKFFGKIGNERRAHEILEAYEQSNLDTSEVHSILGASLKLLEGCKNYDETVAIMYTLSEIPAEVREAFANKMLPILKGTTDGSDRSFLIIKSKDEVLEQVKAIEKKFSKWESSLKLLSKYISPKQQEIINNFFSYLEVEDQTFYKEFAAHFNEGITLKKLLNVIESLPPQAYLKGAKAIFYTKHMGIYATIFSYFSKPIQPAEMPCLRKNMAELIHLLKEDEQAITRLFDPSSTFRLTESISRTCSLLEQVSEENQETVIKAILHAERYGFFESIITKLVTCDPQHRAEVASIMLLFKNKEELTILLSRYQSMIELTNNGLTKDEIYSLFILVDDIFLSNYSSNKLLLQQLGYIWKNIDTKDLTFVTALAQLLEKNASKVLNDLLIKWNSIPKNEKKKALASLTAVMTQERALFVALEMVDFILGNRWEMIFSYFLEACLLGDQTITQEISLVQIFKNCSESQAKEILATLKALPSSCLKNFINMFIQLSSNEEFSIALEEARSLTVVDDAFLSCYPDNKQLLHQLRLVSKNIKNKEPLFLHVLATLLDTRDFHLLNRQLIEWNSAAKERKAKLLSQLSSHITPKEATLLAFEITVGKISWEVIFPYFLEIIKLNGQIKSNLVNLLDVFRNCIYESHAKEVATALKAVPPSRLIEFIKFLSLISLEASSNKYFLLAQFAQIFITYQNLTSEDLMGKFNMCNAMRVHFEQRMEENFGPDAKIISQLIFPCFSLSKEFSFQQIWLDSLTEALALLPPSPSSLGELSSAEILILLFNQAYQSSHLESFNNFLYSFIDIHLFDPNGDLDSQKILLQALHFLSKKKKMDHILTIEKKWMKIKSDQCSRVLNEFIAHFKDPVLAASFVFELISGMEDETDLNELTKNVLKQVKTAPADSEKAPKKLGDSLDQSFTVVKLHLVSAVLFQGITEKDDLQILNKIVTSFDHEQKEEGIKLLRALFRGMNKEGLGTLLEALDKAEKNLFHVIKAALDLRIDDANCLQNETLIAALSSIPVENLSKVIAFVKAEFSDIEAGHQLSSVVKNICRIPLLCFDQSLALLASTGSPTPWLRTDLRESLLILLSKHDNEDVYLGMLTAIVLLLKQSHNPDSIIDQMELWDNDIPSIWQGKASIALQSFPFFTADKQWDVLLSMVYPNATKDEWFTFVESLTQALLLTSPEHYRFWILMFKKAKADESRQVLDALAEISRKFDSIAWPSVVTQLISIPLYTDIGDTSQRLTVFHEILRAVNHPHFFARTAQVQLFLSHIVSLVAEIRSGTLRAELIKQIARHLPKDVVADKSLIDSCLVGLTLIPYNQRAGVVKTLIEILSTRTKSEREAFLSAIVDFNSINRADAIKFIYPAHEMLIQSQPALLLYLIRDHFENPPEKINNNLLIDLTTLVSEFQCVNPEDSLFLRLIAPQVRKPILERLLPCINDGTVKTDMHSILNYVFLTDVEKQISATYFHNLFIDESAYRFTPDYPEADYRLAVFVTTCVNSFPWNHRQTRENIVSNLISIQSRARPEMCQQGDNSYYLYKELKNAQAREEITPVNAVQVFSLRGNQKVNISLDSEPIRKMAQKDQLTYSVLPKNYRQHSFIDLLRKFDNRIKLLGADEQTHIQKAIWHTCLGFSNQANADAEQLGRFNANTRANLELALNSSYLTELINAFGSPEAPIDNSKYYVHAILESIYDQSNDRVINVKDPGSYLTARERSLFSLAGQLILCSTGQQDGLSQYYTLALDKKYKNKALVANAHQDEFVGATEKIEKCLDQNIQQILEEVCKNVNFLKIVTQTPIQAQFVRQESHQTVWVFNRLKKALALNHRLAFDPYSRCINPHLITTSTQFLIKTVLENIPIQKLMDNMQKNITEGLLKAGIEEKEKAQKSLVSAKQEEENASKEHLKVIGTEKEEDALFEKSRAERYVKKIQAAVEKAEEVGRQRFFNALLEYMEKTITKEEKEYNPLWMTKYCQIEYDKDLDVKTPFSGLTDMGALVLLKALGYISGWKIQKARG